MCKAQIKTPSYQDIYGRVKVHLALQTSAEGSCTKSYYMSSTRYTPTSTCKCIRLDKSKVTITGL